MLDSEIFHDLAHFMNKEEELGPTEVLDMVVKWIEEAIEVQQSVFGQVSNCCVYGNKHNCK